MIPIRTLAQAAGVMGWVSPNVQTLDFGFVGCFDGSSASARTMRNRRDCVSGNRSCGSLPMCEIWIDACPTGIGGYVAKPAGYFMHSLTNQDAQWISADCRIGDLAWQTEFDMFAVLCALRFFSRFLPRCPLLPRAPT